MTKMQIFINKKSVRNFSFTFSFILVSMHFQFFYLLSQKIPEYTGKIFLKLPVDLPEYTGIYHNCYRKMRLQLTGSFR
jgi:hypothetical protein